MFKLYNPKFNGTHKKLGGGLNKIL